MSTSLSSATTRIGQSGEDQAVDYLERKGWEIVERNFRCPDGEIDIIALDRQTLVFVEVKTRNTDFFGHPSEAVTPAKIQKIQRAVQVFFEEYRCKNEFRFDIISILPDRLEHFENVTL